MNRVPLLLAHMRMAFLLWASILPGFPCLFASETRGDEANDLITQAQGLQDSADHEASKIIDTLANKGLRESGYASGMIRKHFDQAASINQKPGQVPLKNVPFIHEGQKKCQGQGSASRPSGKCPSSLFESLEVHQRSRRSSGVTLLVFVSASVPADSLKELWNQANRIGARLLFRGLMGGSFKETQNYIRELGIVVDIDPEKFDKFDISRVPAFVLSQGNTHDKMIGNVTLGAFLERSSVNGALQEAARDLFRKLQGGQV